MDQNIIEKAKKIKLLVLDADGVLTNGGMIYDDKGRQLKEFNVKDGLGIFLLSREMKVVILTAKISKVVRRRAKEMNISEVFYGVPKSEVFDGILKKYKIAPENICFIGDDIIDIEVAKRVGFSVAVEDACPELKKQVDFITKKRGGSGAVRELVEIIMKSQGLWKW